MRHWFRHRLFAPRFFAPRFPRPFTPAGVKGSLNSQFGFLGRIGVLTRKVAMRVCLRRLVNVAVVVDGCVFGAAAAVGKAVVCLLWQEQPRWRAQRANKRVQGERSERAHAVFGLPGP